MGDDHADIAIVTVLEEEYSAVLGAIGATERDPGRPDFPNAHAWKIGYVQNEATRGQYRVVVALADGPGQNSGSVAVAQTIRRWHPRYVLLVGIAGGLPIENLRKGDVVVSTVIWYYEYGKMEEVFVPRINYTYQVDRLLLTNARACAVTLNWQEGLGINPDGRSDPKVVCGPIASGEKVVEMITDEFFAQVQKMFPKLQAIEMEGAGAAAAVQSAQAEGEAVGFLMIRGISDMPASGHGRLSSAARNSSIRSKWKSYAAKSAAQFTTRFIATHWPYPATSTIAPDPPSTNPQTPIEEFVIYVRVLRQEKSMEDFKRLASARLSMICTDLEPQEKARVLRFVVAEGLIAKEEPIIDLSQVDLSGADLSGANLSRINLRRANLSRAILIGANFRQANLSGATLVESDLRESDLTMADLSDAILTQANLTNADMTNAVLRKANLSYANLKNAVVHNADLWNTNLRGTILEGVRPEDIGRLAGEVKAGPGNDVENVIYLKEGEPYVFRVVGDSMEHKDIYEGDYVVVIASSARPSEGDVVVTKYLPYDTLHIIGSADNYDESAMVGPTVKMFHRIEGDTIYLLGWDGDVNNAIRAKDIRPLGKVVATLPVSSKRRHMRRNWQDVASTRAE